MRLQRTVLAGLYPSERAQIVRRNPVPDAVVREQAAAIVADVRDRGDAALQAANHRFGGGRPLQPRAEAPELAAALAGLDPALRAAIEDAAGRIRRFHEAQRPQDQEIETAPGVTVARRWSPLRLSLIHISEPTRLQV